MDKIFSSKVSNFIDDTKINSLLAKNNAVDKQEINDILQKSLSKTPLELHETARLLQCDSPDLQEEIFNTARKLKVDVYGNRIVIFAPLYIGNNCVNNCLYCGFRNSNAEARRHTLSDTEIISQVEALEDMGHKRLILVFGEHSKYDAEFIANSVHKVANVKKNHGEIRRVNINAAPLDKRGFATVKQAGIGTYQIFQETYNEKSYKKWHPQGTIKGDYLWRLDSLSRAMEAGIDDVGIGALFGLSDYKYDVLGLVSHAKFLQDNYGVGPHTVSFPRLRPALGSDFKDAHFVNDAEMKRIVAILRLSIPYTGLILTAREPAALRKELLAFGVSQIDAGSNIEIGGYSAIGKNKAALNKAQFELADLRTLDEIIFELASDSYIPSFCTACYRMGRTGEHFMEFAIPGFISNLCTPNALSTFKEYLVDYASQGTKSVGNKLIELELNKLPEGQRKDILKERLNLIGQTEERDLYF